MSFATSEGKVAAATDTAAMWDQIQRMPFEQLLETDDFVYIKKVMSLVTRYIFLESDPNMSSSERTINIAKLLRIVSAKGLQEIERLEKTLKDVTAESSNMRSALSAQVTFKEEEVEKLRGLLVRRQNEEASPQPGTALTNSEELTRLRVENDTLTYQLRSLNRQNEELKQSLKSRNEDMAQVNENYEKSQLEYRHLAARYKRLADRSTKTEDMLRELQRKERTEKHNTDDELERLRQKVHTLQQETYTLVQSRDRAEELCEKREAEALRDMTELRRITKDLLDEERANSQNLREEFAISKAESDAHVEQLMHQHEVELGEREEEIILLRRQLERVSNKPKGRFNLEASGSESSSSSLATDPSRDSNDAKGRSRGVSTEEQRRLERENDDLHAEVDQLELRIDALDEENRRLTRLIKNYESGNEGMYRLRQELADHSRTVEVLQAENAQLRERLNGMEDSVTFNAALRELCKRVGVTEAEINSLRPQNAAAYSEMDTLKEELSLLKEEIEWLEKERRFWMNKVRLQPLMDTKLRFELGLTSEQLVQLDKLVDQMKSGALIVEENDESYKDKYFKELQARRRDAEQFNAFVKERIAESLKNALVDVSAPDTAAAVSALREHIDIITASSAADTAAQAQDKIDKLVRQLDEMEKGEKTHIEEITRLREQVIAGTAEKEVICRERDQYRDAIFGAAGVAASPQTGESGAGAGVLGAFGQGSAGTLSNAKWLSVANTLREQLSVKDTLIEALSKEISETKEKLRVEHSRGEALMRSAELERAEEASLQDQIKALTNLNEELTEKCGSLTKLNKDLEEGVERLDRGLSKELLLKVVLLRRREATLLQRLRRALCSQEESAAAEKKLQGEIKNTLEKLRESLEGGTTADAVLPRSAAGYSMEDEMLGFLDDTVQHVLQGRLFREDSRHLVHLKQVYQGMEAGQELAELRLDAKRLRQSLEAKQVELDGLLAEVADLRAASAGAENAQINGSAELVAASQAKMEAETASYKQKYMLAMKRLETRDDEVAQLEKDLDMAHQEVIEVRGHIQDILNERAQSQAESASSSQRTHTGAMELRSKEKEIARLKTVNLGLLHHSMDLQSQAKSLELEMEAQQREITLLKSSADSEVVTSFVSAAIREHSALRRQGELALIQVKRLRMQLAASEANFHVVSNEATAYKLGAYRLYRKYVDQVVRVVDYLRYVQRASKGALSSHQAEIMDRRLRKTVADLVECFDRSKMSAMELSDAKNAVATLEHRVSLLQMADGATKRDALDAKLQEARARVREHDRLMTECQEEIRFLQSKLSRTESTNKDLNDEVARLEFGAMTLSPLDEEMLATLLELKENVFDKAVTPSGLIAGKEIAASYKLNMDSGEEGDTAVREYRNAMLRQTELAQQCATLKTQLADVATERRRAEHAVAQLKEEVQQMGERVTFVQRQLEEERQKAAQREVRQQRAHEMQSEVARRATEHNVQCLQEMIQKKEQLITSLQDQLSAERRKHVEYELDEAVRMERLHEHMFRENTSMMERFKSAIETVGGSIRQTEENANAQFFMSDDNGGAHKQLQVLTAETVRLRHELQETRATNIVLESQLEQQVNSHLTSQPAPLNYSETPPQSSAQIGSNNNALTAIVRNQTAMIESLRQREMQLSDEVHREKEQRLSAEKLLTDALSRQVEQKGTLQLFSQVTASGAATDAALVNELRAQNVTLEQELRTVRLALEEERAHARQFQMDASEWKSHLDALQSEVAAQQAETARAEQLAAMNEGLRSDLNAVKEQNDKLMLAATVLKQKLIEEAHRTGESQRHHQQEIALAQRMGTIQQESAGHMRVLDHRIRAIQKELDERVEKEKSMLEKSTESQRLVYQLHQQLRAKDRELTALQDRLRQRVSSPQRSPQGSVPLSSNTENRGTQMLSDPTASPSPRSKESDALVDPNLVGSTTVAPSKPTTSTGDKPAASNGSSNVTVTPASVQDALLQPQIAGIVQRETQRLQRDNAAQISTLRSRSNRLEKDLSEAEEQLKGEREGSRHLRAQLRQLREQLTRREAEYASQLAAAHQRATAALPHTRDSTTALYSERSMAPAPVTAEHRETMTTAESGSERALKEKNAALEQTIHRYQQELNEMKGLRAAAVVATVDPAHLTSPADMRAHVEEVRRLESVIDELRRRSSVEAPVRENELQLRLSQANSVVQRMAADMATLRGISVQEVTSLYAYSSNAAQETVDELRMELIQKSNKILEQCFTIETMELQLSRLQRHLDDVLASNAVLASRKSAPEAESSKVEVLGNVIENLKLLVEKLQMENTDLRSLEAQSARYARQSLELRELRGREQQLQAQLQALSQQLAGARRADGGGSASAASNSELHRRLASAQATAEQYEVELESLRLRLSEADRRDIRPLDPMEGTTLEATTLSGRPLSTIPPPLPQSPFSQHQQYRGSLLGSSTGPLQRRLSSTRLSGGDSASEGRGSAHSAAPNR